MFDRTVRSRIDTLSFVEEFGECWAVYRDWKFRIEGDDEKRVFFLGPDGSELRWTYLESNETHPYTKNWQGSLPKVTRKSMDHIDSRIREQAKWPECC